MTVADGKKRADGQLSGLAGEFFVAAELLKRGIQTSVTFGNAKAIDLLATNPETDEQFTVQVKTLRRRNWFPIDCAKAKASHIYVFVLLNKPDQPVDYFIVPGRELTENPGQFGKGVDDLKFPGINWSALGGYKNNWAAFGLEG
ncbi:MAG: PDDEXK-like family protein [Coriobacteriia bacterium]|jgi:hypothetical protein